MSKVVSTTVRLDQDFFRRLKIAMIHMEVRNFNTLLRNLLNEWLKDAEKQIRTYKS